MNGAQALIESLLEEQVTHIFGYAGATICPAVDALTARLAQDGYPVVSPPRVTGDGYYESCVLDSEGTRVEITG